MRILPVLDLLDGTVVRGVAGQRETYRPIESTLTDRTDPLSVASAIRDSFGLNEFYVADLDGILNSTPNWNAYRQLNDAGFRCHVDAGVRDSSTSAELIASGAASVIVCLETNPSTELLNDVLRTLGSERTVFSLDLRGGELMGAIDGQLRSTLELIDKVAQLGFTRLIVLDLHAVGVGTGPITIPLCREIRQRYSQMEIITGGGVRNVRDLKLLENAGVDAALVASALHNGQITPDDLQNLLGGRSSC